MVKKKKNTVGGVLSTEYEEETEEPIKEEKIPSVKLGDWLRAINQKTKLDLTDDNEKEYNPFIINRCMASYPDTVLIADEVNRMRFASKKMQFDFYVSFVPRKRRFSQWEREYQGTEKDLLVMEYLGVSLEKAIQYTKQIDLLKNADLVWQSMKEKTEKGGVSR